MGNPCRSRYGTTALDARTRHSRAPAGPATRSEAPPGSAMTWPGTTTAFGMLDFPAA